MPFETNTQWVLMQATYNKLSIIEVFKLWLLLTFDGRACFFSVLTLTPLAARLQRLNKKNQTLLKFMIKMTFHSDC